MGRLQHYHQIVDIDVDIDCPNSRCHRSGSDSRAFATLEYMSHDWGKASGCRHRWNGPAEIEGRNINQKQLFKCYSWRISARPSARPSTPAYWRNETRICSQMHTSRRRYRCGSHGPFDRLCSNRMRSSPCELNDIKSRNQERLNYAIL